jgi:two-component system, OmpR family, response regulator RegX3
MVLVVDDDPAFSNELSRLLKKAGYTTIQAKDGKEAVQAMRKHEASIGAAIVDLALPEVGGFQVIGEIVNIRRKSPIPLLAVTGAYKDLYLEVAEYLGAQASIRKPEAGQSLTPVMEAFERLMRPQRASSPPA